MGNPIPMFGVPDTRPGYAFQDPGAGGAVAGGIQAVLAALLQKQKQEQAQAEFQLEQQRAAQNASYQNTLLAQEQARQDAARQAAMAQAMGNQQVGQAIGRIGTNTPVDINVPQGIAGGMGMPLSIQGAPVGPQVTPEQAARNLPADLIPDFYQAGRPAIEQFRKGQEEAKAVRRDRATAEALANLPGLKGVNDFVKKALAEYPDADPNTIREVAMQVVGKQVPQATLDAITKKLKLEPGLPQEVILRTYEAWLREKANADFRPPSAAGTTPGNKTVTVGGVGQLSDWQSMLDATRGAREAFAALKGADATGIVTGRLADLGGQMGRPSGGTVGVVARSRLANITTALGKLRSGGAITPQEFERLQPLLPQKNEDETSVVVPKLQELEAYVASVIQRRLDALEAAGYNVTEIRRSFNANAMGVRTPEMMNAELPPYRPKGMTP